MTNTTEKKWVLPTLTKEMERGLEKLEKEDTYGFSPAVLKYLYNRGVRSGQDISKLIENGPETEHSPFEMKDIKLAVSHLVRAINEDKKIVVYGDYDSDGICSTSIAVLALRNLGARVDYFINNRFVEGYGISPLGVDNLLEKIPDAQFILTVDNGIVAFDGVKYAVDKGLEVLVTDHHIAKKELPEEALAVVNPHRLDDDYPFSDICGAAVIYKVMMALYWELKQDLDYVQDMLDFVGMATIGDVMPLKDENRFFVKESLRLIQRGTRKQMTILKDKKKVTLNEEAFGYVLNPILNAEGRLKGTPTRAVDFFLSTDENEMDRLADELIKINEERKELTAVQEELGSNIVESKGLKSIIIVSDKNFHEGIVGLVAGRLKETFTRPVIVFSEEGEYLKGSARSIEAFNIKEGLDKVSALIEKFGGHKLAAGLTIKKENLDEFEDALVELVDSILTDEDLIPKVIADVMLQPHEVTEELVAELDIIRPFGQGFEKPLFGLTSFYVNPDKTLFMGQEKNHLKLTEEDCGLQILMFKHAEMYKDMGEPRVVKALGYPTLNIFRNNISVQFSVSNDYLLN